MFKTIRLKPYSAKNLSRTLSEKTNCNQMSNVIGLIVLDEISAEAYFHIIFPFLRIYTNQNYWTAISTLFSSQNTIIVLAVY